MRFDDRIQDIYTVKNIKFNGFIQVVFAFEITVNTLGSKGFFVPTVKIDDIVIINTPIFKAAIKDELKTGC